MELPELDAALEGYGTALELAAGEPSIHREVREMLSATYAKLVEVMPSVFALDRERGRREPIIVRSLLLQVPGVHKVAIDKLYAAGINGLDVLYAARPRELAEATGLDEALATAICERFQRYRREVSELGPGKEREKERAELRAADGRCSPAARGVRARVAGVDGGRDGAPRRTRGRTARTPRSPSTSCSRTWARSTSCAPSPSCPSSRRSASCAATSTRRSRRQLALAHKLTLDLTRARNLDPEALVTIPEQSIHGQPDT